ncbi:MAG TPA: cytochrome b/b6 domain-containing protein [Bryobacteraceae bacterium]|nr:cytochrome b/b6 domain-containing protein [Bryobacteraceae bacterium]
MSRAGRAFLKKLGSVLFCFSLWAAGATPRAQAAADPNCSSCHDQGQKLAKSAHAALDCATCHENHEKYPHPAGVAKPACTNCHESQAGDYARGVHGQAASKGNAGAPDCAVCHGSAHELLPPKSAAFRSKVPETCGMCHSEVVEQFNDSVHGQALARGVTQAPLCTDCHGEHSILPHTNAASPVSAGNIRETCGSCHGDVRLSRKFGLPSDRLVSFDASYHGLAAKSGSQTVANCASCHGVHNILPSSDPRSTINAKNLPATCGHCHPGAGQRFRIGPVHVTEARGEPTPVRWARQFYLLMIPLVIGLMLLHNGGDWVRKAIRLRRRPVSYPGGEEIDGVPNVRMLPFERVQHAVLVLSFGTLVWTGFALKYPDQWWARPLLLWEGSQPLRGIIHRVAAGVFIAVTVTHLVSLFVSRPLRRHWREMWPNRRDPAEALANFSYNLGFRTRDPGRSVHSYIEKAEYWAVVWGAVVMILTGIVLWANNLMLALFPKVWLDVATSVHFYEAVLATLAIVVWHFYTVIFDPDVYPMDTAWLTGVSVRKHPSLAHEPQLEAPAAAVAGKPKEEPDPKSVPTTTPSL